MLCHLFRVCKKIFPDSKIAKSMTCAATKATCIANEIGHTYNKEVIAHMKATPFTLMIDESNDHGSDKVLALLARTCDPEPETKFVTMLPCPDGTARAIFKQIDDFFR